MLRFVHKHNCTSIKINTSLIRSFQLKYICNVIRISLINLKRHTYHNPNPRRSIPKFPHKFQFQLELHDRSSRFFDFEKSVKIQNKIQGINQLKRIRKYSSIPSTMASNNFEENGSETAEVDRFYCLIDIGANLTNKKFSRDVDSVVNRAKEAGVLKIMVTGTNISISKEALRLTRLFPDTLFATAGIHPHDAKTFDETSISEIESLCLNPEVVALGECGLDFNRNFSPPEIQLEVFEKQVELACRLKKPLFLHERDAHEEMLKVLKKYQDQLPPAVLHCFTGTVEQARVYIEMGLYIGLTGYVWKDKSENGVRQMLSDNVVPLDRLLLETDAPFMFPNTRSAKLTAEMKQLMTPRSLNFLNRHCTFQRNEPCSLPATLEIVSALMKKHPEEVAMATTYNAVKIFGLSA